jgi:hypothetical protein
MMRGFRDMLADIVPVWLSNRPGLNVGYSVLYTMALTLDCMVEAGRQGVQAAWPGYGTPTADPYIAATRQLVQGETETQSAFEARLRAWVDMWTAGSVIWPNRAALAQRIHEYLGNNPQVTIISRAGQCVTVSATGGITYNVIDQGPVPFDWDNLSNPSRSGWWSDIWLIISPPEWAAETRSLSTIASTYGTFAAWNTGLGIGHPVPRATVDALQGLLAQWKGAHTNIRGIIWNYNSTQFDPTNAGSFPTNGYWGPWAFMTDGNAATPQRSSTDRYWECNVSLPQ